MKHYIVSLINYITVFVKNDEHLNNVFNNTHFNKKYTFNQLLEPVIYSVIYGYPLRNINSKHNPANIHWNTIYKFKCKLAQSNVLNLIHTSIINDYLKDTNGINRTIYIDSSLIDNKNGSECVSFCRKGPLAGSLARARLRSTNQQKFLFLLITLICQLILLLNKVLFMMQQY